MSKEFETDSLHGLIFMLGSEVISTIQDEDIKKRALALLTEIDNRVTKSEEELSEIIDSIENIKGSL